MNSKRTYVDYDKDRTFTSGVEQADETEIKRLLEVGKFKCAYATKRIVSGNQVVGNISGVHKKRYEFR